MAISLMAQIGDESQQQQPIVKKVERLMFSSSDNTREFIVEQNVECHKREGLYWMPCASPNLASA